MLEVQRVSSYYGNTPIVQDVSLSVGNGEFLAVLGRNGVGKTTLLKTLMGLTDRVDGHIVMDGTDITHVPAHERSLRGIGYVPQGRGIIPRFTVRENIILGTFARRDGMRDHLERMGGLLSGGQQQQLALARALAVDPNIILLDEPAEGIQPNVVEQLERAIVSLNRDKGISVILVEQNVSLARRAADRFVMMEKGRIAAEGPIETLSDELVHRHMAV
jgi:urea transport system ATP-binding protein